MDARTRDEIRDGVSQRRVRPHDPQRIFFAADSLGQCPTLQPDRPLELHIEATTRDGQLAPWLTDEWWISTQRACEGRAVTIMLLPSCSAVLEDVIIHQLEMVRRIAPNWRIIGYAAVEEVRKQPDLSAWVCTPYDEIRFFTTTGEARKAAFTAAEQLVAQAALSPRQAGTHRACLRLTHAPPREAHATAPQAAPPADLAEMRRIFESNPVEST